MIFMPIGEYRQRSASASAHETCNRDFFMKLKSEDQQKIIAFLQSKMKLRLLILYGSYASGDATEKSDIDLAFYADDAVDATAVFLEISPELASLMQVESVDLVNLKEVDTVFRFIIVSTGEVIFQEGDFEAYLDRAYTMYLQLNDDRREILENYSEMVSGWRDNVVLKGRYVEEE